MLRKRVLITNNNTMTDQEILKAVIAKATDNGLKTYKQGYLDFTGKFPNVQEVVSISFTKYLETAIKYKPVEEIIFSHEFCKAFWGEWTICSGCGKHWAGSKTMGYSCDSICPAPNEVISWRHHLQQLVVEEDRLKYLEQFLDN